MSFERRDEDGQRLGIAEEVDVALAIALFDIGQTVPFLGRRQQALGEERDLLGEDGQLAGLGVAEPAVDSDQIAQVEQFDDAPAFVADLFLADEDLDPLGPVAKVEEVDFPLPAAQHDPPGDANGGAGRLAAGLSRRNRQRADRRDGLVPLESLAPGVDSQGGNPLELFQANGFEALTRLVGHLVPLLLLDQSLRANRTPNCMDLAG